MKNKLSKLALAVTFGIALTFTFSCSGGDDDLPIKHEDDDKTYKDFADKNFSVSKYEKAMNDIYNSMYPDNLKNLYGTERENYCKIFYGNNVSFVNSCVVNFGINAGEKPDDNTPLYDSTAYYQIIANENFVLGWADAILNDQVEANLNQENPAYIKLGTSASYDKYIALRKTLKKAVLPFQAGM